MYRTRFGFQVRRGGKDETPELTFFLPAIYAYFNHTDLLLTDVRESSKYPFCLVVDSSDGLSLLGSECWLLSELPCATFVRVSACDFDWRPDTMSTTLIGLCRQYFDTDNLYEVLSTTKTATEKEGNLPTFCVWRFLPLVSLNERALTDVSVFVYSSKGLLCAVDEVPSRQGRRKG